MNRTDEELVFLYQKGETEVFNEIYDRYKNLVKFYSRNLFLLGAESDDLVQEGMLGLIKAVNSYNSDKSSFKTFATLCIKSSLYTAVKKYSNEKMLPLNNSDSIEIIDEFDKFGPFVQTPETAMLDKETSSEFNCKISKNLSQTELKVLKFYLEGLSYVEISEKLNKNKKFVDNALSRVRKKIIKCLGE